MENTYIPELPNGSEEGTYLALDLGGTNFRVILLELAKGEFLKEEFKFYHISDEARLGCGISLFDYLAECVKDFMLLKNLPIDVKIPMGFTFSFPMKQHSLHSAELVTWTKSFNCPSVVGCDVVQLLQSSLRKHGMKNIDVLSILNDTTGTLVIYGAIRAGKNVLMAFFFFSFFSPVDFCQCNNQVEGARLDNKTRIGMILGTGSNAAFLERADRVHHWEGERHGEKNVIIDIEWGAFGDKGTWCTFLLFKVMRTSAFCFVLGMKNEQLLFDGKTTHLTLTFFFSPSSLAGTIDFIRTEHDKEVDNGSLLKRSFT